MGLECEAVVEKLDGAWSASVSFRPGAWSGDQGTIDQFQINDAITEKGDTLENQDLYVLLHYDRTVHPHNSLFL